MFKVTRFCVQPYRYQGERLVPGEPSSHYRRESALDTMQRMRRRVAGAAVYEVTGWPVQDLWDRPVLVAKAGVLPAES